jgi:hypothetical protein
MRLKAGSPLWPTFILSLLGLLWCAYIAFPVDAHLPCATSGCEIFRDSKFAGLSLWWVGGAFFFVYCSVCLRGYRFLAWLFIMAALFLDALLLIIMLFTAPCLDCLVVAALMGLCACTLLPLSRETPGFRPLSLLIPIWFGLFLSNGVLAANEQIPEYTISGESKGEVRLYFSPSCSACREAIRSLGARATLYPVEEREGDFDSIILMERFIREGASPEEALQRSLAEEMGPVDLPLTERVILSMQLLRNKAAVMRQGFRALPLIQINGMPRLGLTDKNQGLPSLPANTENPARSRNSPHPDEIPDFLQSPGELGQCVQGSDEPCD